MSRRTALLDNPLATSLRPTRTRAEDRALLAEQQAALRARFEAAQAEANRRRWSADPSSWIRERLGEFVWSRQVEILESVRDNRLTAVPSCHNSGKSWLAARTAEWWIDTHPLGDAFVVTSATTWKQVRAVLWREMGRAHAKGKLPGRMNQTEWLITMPAGNEEQVAFGHKPQDNDPTAFHGIHARYVLVIFDEATGLAKPLWEAADSLISNADSHFFAIGNPDDPLSHMATVCKPGSGWSVIKISAFDTPNFTNEEVPDDVKARLVSPQWVEEKKKHWGESNPLYISKVLGEFPPYSQDSLIPMHWIKAAHERWGKTLHELREEHALKIPETDAPEISVLGVDVGGGSDKNVIAHRLGRKVSVLYEDFEPDTMKTADQVANWLKYTGASVARIDAIGIGRGAADRLTKTDRLPVEAVQVSEKATNDKDFFNLRAEGYWHLRMLFQNNAIDIDPRDEDLFAQLLDIRYETAGGRILIESKDSMRRRGKKSPDRADAVMLACIDTLTRPKKTKATWGRR